MRPEMCAVCEANLGTQETIWVAEGVLYCSRECGIHDFEHAYGDNATEYFDAVAEEVNPHDIGIGGDYNEQS